MPSTRRDARTRAAIRRASGYGDVRPHGAKAVDARRHTGGPRRCGPVAPRHARSRDITPGAAGAPRDYPDRCGFPRGPPAPELGALGAQRHDRAEDGRGDEAGRGRDEGGTRAGRTTGSGTRRSSACATPRPTAWVWFELGRTDWIRARDTGLTYRTLEGRGILLPVSHAWCRYRRSALRRRGSRRDDAHRPAPCA